MKNFFYCSLIVATSAFASSIDVQPLIEDVVKSVLPNTKVHKIAKSPIYGVYSVFSGDNVFYVDPKQKLVIFGEIYSKNGTSITRLEREKEAPQIKKQRISEISSKQIKTILSDSIADERFGGQFAFAIFTNPHCPHCKKLENFIADKEIDAFYILLGNASENEKYLSAENPALAYRMKLQDAPTTEEGIHKLEKMTAIASEHGVTGTPTVFVIDRQTNKVVDYIVGANMPQIETWIEKNKTKGSK